jgi:hypothetical protein
MTFFDPAFLSRLQFAWVIGWHILLPAFTVGAASFIAVAEGLSLTTGREVYARVSISWTKILFHRVRHGGPYSTFQERPILAGYERRQCRERRPFSASRDRVTEVQHLDEIGRLEIERQGQGALL